MRVLQFVAEGNRLGMFSRTGIVVGVQQSIDADLNHRWKS